MKQNNYLNPTRRWVYRIIKLRNLLIFILLSILGLPSVASLPPITNQIASYILQGVKVNNPSVITEDIYIRVLSDDILNEISNSIYKPEIAKPDNDAFSVKQRMQHRQVISFNLVSKNNVIKTYYLPIEVSIFKKVAMSSTILAKGDIISSQNTVLATRDITVLPSKLYGTYESLLYKEARFTISEDRVLTDHLIKDVPVFRDGDSIKLRISTGKVTVEAEGLARSEGYIGKKVRVQNKTSRQYLEGIVLDKNIVEIR